MLLSDFIEELKTYQDMYGDVEVMQGHDGFYNCIIGVEVINVTPSDMYEGEFFEASNKDSYYEKTIAII